MKKFSKILVLLLSLIAIVTAFTVVALATEEATEKTAPVVLKFTSTDGTSTTDVIDFQGFADGAEILDNDTKLGGWDVYTSDNGENKYMASGKYPESGTNAVERLDLSFSNMTAFGLSEVDTKSYSIDKYPTFAFDFDIMSPTGSYDAAWGNAYVSVRVYKDGSVGGTTEAKNFKDLGLSNVPYEWQHLTLVMTYIGDDTFESRYFVNGVEVEESSLTKQMTDLAGATSKVRAQIVYLGPLLNNDDDNMLCMDNLKFSYYTNEYTAEEVANYVYNEDYELPWGRTVASIVENEVETKYDNFEEAYAAANENNVLNLYVDTSYAIDKAMTVVANGCTFTNTNSLYIDADAGVNTYKFEKKPPVDPNNKSTDFEDYDLGELKNSDTTQGKWSIYASDNGENQYLVSEYDPPASGTLRYDFTGIGHKDYNIGNYPIFAFDLDVMTPTGKWDAYWSEASFYFNFYYNNASNLGNIGGKNFLELYELGAFSTVPYEWHHLTITVEYIGNDIFELRYFVNGKEVEGSSHQSSFATLAGATSQARVQNIYCYPYLDSDENDDKLGYDNFKYSYYPKGYTVDEVATYVYNEDYELPWGRHVASIVENGVETKFDNFAEVLALANVNNTIKLYADVTCTIDKAMTIKVEANGFAFNWTSDIYVDVNEDANIYEFQKKPPYVNTDKSTDFEDKADGDVILNTDTKHGKWTVYTDDAGNSYLVSEYEAPSVSDLDQYTIGVGDKAYNVGSYPIFAFDFDIMSPTGNWDSYWGNPSILLRAYYSNNSNLGNLSNKNINDLGLSTTPYEWQHVTVVVNFEGNGIFRTHYFVNGKEVADSALVADYSEKLGTTTQNARVQLVYLYPFLDDSVNDDKMCMDNFKFSYYPKGYTVDEVATYVYNTSYELPESEIVASIVSGNSELKFDSFAKAYAAANKNNTLKLYKDATCVIDKAINVDANGFAFNYTGANFVDVNADANVYELRHAGEVYLTDVWFNLSYYTGFKYNLYLPANETLNINSVSWGEGAEVYMNESKYFVYTFDATTTTAADITEVTVNYTADGNTYTQTYKLSALVYATLALPDTTGELETKAVSNMVRYIKEARAQAGIEDTNDYTDLIAGATEYQETYDDLGASYAALDGVGISLALNGTTVAYAIDVTAFADATVTAKLGDTEIAVTKSGDFWFTESAKVYDIVGNLITITVHTSEGDLVGTFSVGAYINLENNTLAKAMYEFGVAAAAYKASITG